MEFLIVIGIVALVLIIQDYVEGIHVQARIRVRATTTTTTDLRKEVEAFVEETIEGQWETFRTLKQMGVISPGAKFNGPRGVRYVLSPAAHNRTETDRRARAQRREARAQEWALHMLSPMSDRLR